uniref:Uncharacterized protein n=1 Tax=Solanum lycopersicum TaxID=4081 RepID=A0A3Q7G2D5_SOLLC
MSPPPPQPPPPQPQPLVTSKDESRNESDSKNMDETDSDVEEYEEDVEEYKEEWVDEEDNDSEPLSPRSDDNYDNLSIEELIEELYTPILPCQEKRTESFGRDTSIRLATVHPNILKVTNDEKEYFQAKVVRHLDQSLDFLIIRPRSETYTSSVPRNIRSLWKNELNQVRPVTNSFHYLPQLEEEEQLAEEQSESLNAIYNKYELVQHVFNNGTATRLAKHYKMRIDVRQ